MNRIFTLILLGFFAISSQAQSIVFSETFSNGWPTGFIRVNNDGRPASVQLLNTFNSDAWISRVIGPNDTVAASTSWINPTGTADRWMITPPISITNANHVLRWRARSMDPNNLDGYQVFVRTVTSTNDTNIAGFTNPMLTVSAENQNWTNRIVNLSSFSGQTVRIAFRNNSFDKFILHLDDILVFNLPQVGSKMLTSTMSNFVDLANPGAQVKGVIQNLGIQVLTSIKLNYSINNGAPVSQTFTTNFGPFATYTYNFTSLWTPASLGIYSIKVWASELNGQAYQGDTLERPLSVVNVTSLPERLVLFEHFTQASCGPCASQNPAFTTLLNGNRTSTTSVKYHTSWPGVDPMNAHNPTDVASRVAYYGVSGVPNVILGTSNLGSPTAVSQTTINNEKAKKALFNISMSASMDPGTRLLTISGSAEPAVAFAPTNGNRLQVMLVEDPIIYNTPPGSNGETVFPSTFRKAFPNAEGTIINTVNIPGNTHFFNFNTFTVPSFYVDSNLYVIVFVQNHATKEIHQAAKLKVSNFFTNVRETNASLFKLYPNPASDWVRIETQLAQSGQIEFSIYNMLGQQAGTTLRLDAAAGDFQHSLPIASLKPGIYTLRVSVGNRIESIRFQKF